MNKIHRPLWGATMYVPATRTDLYAVRDGEVAGLNSMVICLEDAVRDDEIPGALANLDRELARGRHAQMIRTYVRPRNAAMLEALLNHDRITNIDGIVLPKSVPENVESQVEALKAHGLAAMPTAETVEFWDPTVIREYAKLLGELKDNGAEIDSVRVGGNDLLSTIHARRSRARTLYDGPVGTIMPQIVGCMARYGIAVSSPVFEHYTNDTLLMTEIQQDIEHGIMNKTAIHPRQVAIINAEYAVTPTELADASDILDIDAKAVFGNEGSMCEPRTHSNWANTILKRRELFGFAGDGQKRQAA